MEYGSQEKIDLKIEWEAGLTLPMKFMVLQEFLWVTTILAFQSLRKNL